MGCTTFIDREKWSNILNKVDETISIPFFGEECLSTQIECNENGEYSDVPDNDYGINGFKRDLLST